MVDASLAAERRLIPTGVVMGIDEVGRGALAGPVMIGIVVAAVDQPDVPGLRDSKLLRPPRREQLVPRIQEWCLHWAVGSASAAMIDTDGIVAAMRHAATEAFASVAAASPRPVDLIVLDGPHNWLADAAPDGVRIHCEAKADQRYATVAAASVLAKVMRDHVMVELHQRHPAYDWHANKGYGSASHRAAIHAHGLSPWHRASWTLSSTADPTV